MESLPESAVHDFQVPHLVSPRGFASFSLGVPVTLPLALGTVVTLATGGLLQVAGPGAAGAT